MTNQEFEILRFLYEGNVINADAFRNDDTLFKKVSRPLPNTSESDYRAALENLFTLKYVTKLPMLGDIGNSHQITDYGKVIYESEFSDRKKIEEDRILTFQIGQAQILQGRWMMWLTLILVGSALIESLFYLCQMYNMRFCSCP